MSDFGGQNAEESRSCPASIWDSFNVCQFEIQSFWDHSLSSLICCFYSNGPTSVQNIWGISFLELLSEKFDEPKNKTSLFSLDSNNVYLIFILLSTWSILTNLLFYPICFQLVNFFLPNYLLVDIYSLFLLYL